MKSRLVSLLVLLFLLALGYVGYVYRYSIAACIWHWKHGYSTTMGNYEVPVPEHWVIEDQNALAFTLMNTSPTRPPRDGKLHTTAVIDIFPFRDRPVEASRIDFWLSQQRQWLTRDGVKYVEEKTLNLGGENLSCIGGSQLSTVVRDIPSVRIPETDIVSLNCMSDHGLNILFVGEPSDLQSFYAFLSQIHRKR
jgi:hypothetical protein